MWPLPTSRRLWLTTAALVVALALLAESFGRDVLWLWHRRSPRRGDSARPEASTCRAQGRAMKQDERDSFDRALRPGAPGGVPAG